MGKIEKYDFKKMEEFFEQIPALQEIYEEWKTLKARVDNLLIPLEEIPARNSFVTKDENDAPILIQNEALFMGYQLSCCEFSEFFIEIMKNQKLFGYRCGNCNDLIIPPVTKQCPRARCNSHDMYKVYVRDVGFLTHTSPIVLYPPSNFKNEAPYALGYVQLFDYHGTEAATYLHMRMRTTQAFLTAEIFNQQIGIKVVFARDRKGTIRDIFGVPVYELTPEQVNKSPLFEDEIEWKKETVIEYHKFDEKYSEVFQNIDDRFQLLSTMIEKSPKAKKNLAGWHRAIRLVTAGGALEITISDGELHMSSDITEPELIIYIADPQHVLNWLIDTTTPDKTEYLGQMFSNLLLDGILKMNPIESETLTKLDRLERSLKIDFQKEKSTA